ncbi:F0F1 ATP synthase subunit delta [Candidatus Pacebacteria bacterium]|nr:F0F1 ATP synthase subunit delta [Candidatus Paceibacterota bacterium]
MKDTYITAVLELLRSGTETSSVVRGLQMVLKARGHETLLDDVLRGVVRILEADDQTAPQVLVAEKSDYETLKADISQALQTVAAEGEPIVSVDSTLIGGFIAEANDTRVDASYKKALRELYQNITN